MMLSPQKFRREMTDLLVGLHQKSYFHHSLMKVTFLAIRRYPANIKIHPQRRQNSVRNVSFPGTFLLCAILEGWDFSIFPPDKVPAAPKK